MKKFYLLLLSLSMGLSSVFADGVVRTYTNVTAGSLSTRISNDNVDPLTITDLTITGNLNGTDLRLIREMAGNNYLGEPKSGSLKKLDLSGANIVAGGEKYLDTDRITSSTGTYTQNNGYNSFHYETENNVLGKSLFAGCDKLEEVILPNSLTAIGEYQFWYCLNLKSISIGKNVSSIGWQLVFGPNKLTNISIAEGNATFSSPANTNLLMQGTKVFFGYGNPTFPAGTTVIGSDAFSSCTGLGDVTLPEGVTTIEGGAFAWSSLKSISFPSTLTTIGNDAFAGCYNLTSFTLPKTVTHYGEGLGALKDCGNLTSISVDKDNPVYDSRGNCNAIIETSTNTLISGCKNTVIPTSVTILGHQAFRGVTLSNYVIPNWITTIGEMAFWNANMTSVTIPNSVTYIGEFAFAYPTSLTTVTVESVTPVAISENTFTDRSNTDLIVPEGCSAAYKGANYWKDFKSIKDTKGNSEDPITEATINVATAGTLSTLISETNKNTIRTLTLTGSLNGEDFRFIREMAGSDYNGVPTDGNLTTLDLSGATIVAGGSYVEIQDKKVYLNKEKTSYTSSGGAVDGVKVSEANKIGAYLFAGCQKLQTITLPNNITAINEFGFWSTGLTAITMPNTVTSIGFDAFFGCWNLVSVAISSSVMSINYPFLGCTNLASITVDSRNSVYDSRNNCNAIIETSSNTLIIGCKNTSIPSSVTTIGSDALAWHKLTSIIIPSSVTTIENRAFSGCALTSLTIPSGVTNIGDQAFANNELQTVTVENPTPVAIYDETFSNRSNIDLIVPEGRSAAYKVAKYWKDFKSIKDTKGNSEDPITGATINVATAGTLATKISNDEKFSITDLTITGPLNGTDFRLLREMAGCDYLGRPTNGQLQKLDLSGATIVAGGDKYFDRDGLYDEDGNMQYGFNSHSVTTRDNVIGECLFAGCSKLEEIKIPTNTIEIGEFAFMRTDISSFDIPEAVVKVALPFFYGTKVSTLHIPKNVTTLTASYFMGNQATLSSITVDANNAKFDSRNNCNAIIEKESNTLLLGCKNTTIPDGVTSIGEYAFSYSYGYTSITLPTSVTSLQEGAFFASGLASISLPSDLKRIEFNALAYTNIASITIPASVEFIGQSALRACTDLTQITVEADNTKYDSRNNCNAIIETATNTLIQGCKTSTIPATVTALGNQAFQECQGLTSITIPSNISSIADNAFAYCNDLISVSVEVETPLAITTNAFTNRRNATLYVPTGCVDAYKEADYWKEFKEIIGTEVSSVRTINVEEEGTLSLFITDDDKFSITELTITGPLNGTDFRLLREMAGNDYQGNLTAGKLSKLDLSGATIVSGGDYYLNTTTIHWTDNTQMVMNNPLQYGTNNNVLGSYLFAGCKSLETIILPKNITAIGNDVFSHNPKLRSLEIPKTVSSIAIGVIQECENLSSLSVESGNQTYSSPEGSNAIIHTANLELVAGCKNTIIPSGTKIIDPYAFQHCISLTSINIPKSITKIGELAFWGCKGLTELKIPASVTQIGDQAFYACSALNSIIVDSENSVYDSRNNCNALIETSSKTLLLGCKNTIIPNDILIIGENAFRPCDGLTSIEIPASVTSIGDNAFAYCYQLERVVSNIADPNNVTMGYTVFDRISDNAILEVPKGTKSSYLAANGWNGFKEIIEMQDPSIRTITVETEGTLATKISSDDMFSITDLTITGPLNGDDLLLIREMAGSDIKGVPTDGKLQKLDLSGATIVAGGTYLNLEGQCIYLDKEKTQPLYGFIAGAKTSVANMFGDYLFAGCQKLQSVKTPKSLATIGEKVFAGSGLTTIELNSGLTAINYCAFWYTKLSSITIPNTVTAIGTNGWIENPFAYNDNLTSITLEAGNSRYSMSAGGKLLIDNTNHAVICALGNEAIPEGITIIGSNAFSNRPELVNYTIPEGVTLTNPSYPNIGNNTFSQCVNLKTITIPEGITVISNAAFVDCTSLNNVTIPSTVTRIGDYAFGNTALSEITIPANVTSIGAEAFAHNKNLETVISYITNPFDISDDVFVISNTNYPQTLKVPSGTGDLYRAKTGWNKIANIVEMGQASAITVTAKSCSRAYGEANPTFESEVTGGTVTGTPEITCTATATSNVGTYPIVISAGTIAETNVQYVNGTLTVTKAPLKISAGNYTKKQGEENPTFTLTYDGFKNNETAAVFTTQPTITCAATKDSPVGTYDITVSGAVAGNYEISYVAGTLTVEAVTPPTPMPEPKGTTFDLDTDDSSSKEVKITFVVKESDGSSTPTVAISDDKDASGSVSIPESVTHNGVEYKVTEISEGAFQNNTSLTEVKIPASITSIGPKAFAGCKNLQEITINIIVPINLSIISARGYTRAESGDVFEGVNKETCILYVPEGSVDAYKAAPVWKDFKNILPIKTSTRIYGIESDGEVFDVYSLSGQKVKSKTTSLDGLPRGIYIIKGKKVIK